MNEKKEKIRPFHLAIPVHDLGKAKYFYHQLLGCEMGRSSDHWIDFNFFGHQLVCHLSDQSTFEISNSVDSEEIPVPHFGLVLDWNEFKTITSELIKKNIKFLIEPTIRFEDEVGEQAIAFIRDPSENAIELKAFKNTNNLFRAK